MDYHKWLALGKEMGMSGEALMEFVERKESQWEQKEKERLNRDERAENRELQRLQYEKEAEERKLLEQERKLQYEKEAEERKLAEQDKKYQFELELDKQRNQQKIEILTKEANLLELKMQLPQSDSHDHKLAMTNHYVLNYLNLRKIKMIWMNFKSVSSGLPKLKNGKKIFGQSV